MIRRLIGTVTFTGKDDETNLGWPFGGADLWKGPITKPFEILLSDGESKKYYNELKWGKECRLEADFVAVCADGRVTISAFGRLFEGDSEQTKDLEDSAGPIVVTIPRGKSGSASMHLRNREAGSNDEGWIAFAFTNVLVEEP